MASFVDANGVEWATERDGEGYAARPVVEPSPYPMSEQWDETEEGALKRARIMVDTLNRLTPGGKFPVKAAAKADAPSSSGGGAVLLLLLLAFVLAKGKR